MGATAQASANPDLSRNDDAVVELIPDLRAEEMDERIRRADRRTETGHRELAFYLAEMQDRGLHQMLGYSSAVEYAGRRLEMSRRHAQELIVVGRALNELPNVDAAFCEGKLRWSRVRLLVRIAVPETERAWLERALELSWTAFDREVATSERGRPPRADRRGLPRTRIVVRGRLERIAYETWELAKQKLSNERGERLTDADCMEYLGAMVLGTRRGAPVEAREPIDDSIYRVIIQKCPSCETASIRTPEGSEELDPRAAARIECDAPSEPVDDDPNHEQKTPKALRRKVLNRDGRACAVCHGRDRLTAHHVVWWSRGGTTDPPNLVTLCAWCHGRVHDELVRISGAAPHRLAITDRHDVPLDQAAPIPNPAIIRVRSTPNAARSCGAVPSPATVPSHRPPRLAEVIGQTRTVRALTVAAKSAKKRGAPVDHVLLLGPPGLGKTTLASALAAEIGTGFHVANGPMIEDPELLIGLLRNLRERDVLFLDEIHALPRRAIECLYEAMEDGRISLTSTDGISSKAERLELARFTLVGATTEIGMLPEAFVSRFPIREHLETYGVGDLATIVSRAAARDGISISEDAAPELARTARGSPRVALGLFRRTRDEAIAADRAIIDRDAVLAALDAAGIDGDGLNPTERRALEVLRRYGRPMGLARWAAASGLPPSTLRVLCEPELLRQDLITVTPRGRMARAQLRAVVRDAVRYGAEYADIPPLFMTG